MVTFFAERSDRADDEAESWGEVILVPNGPCEPGDNIGDTLEPFRVTGVDGRKSHGASSADADKFLREDEDLGVIKRGETEGSAC